MKMIRVHLENQMKMEQKLAGKITAKDLLAHLMMKIQSLKMLI